MRRARAAAAALLAALSACAGPRAAAPTPHEPGSAPIGAPPAAAVEVAEPQPIEVGREDLELAAKNDEELFAIGQAAFAAGDFARAANAFGRVADLHPRSRHHAAALYDAGLAWQRLDEWRLALERFRRFQAEYEGPDAVEASFREAECHFHLGALADARAVLDALAARDDLAAAVRVRALAQRGVVEFTARDLPAAERSLRLAVAAFSRAERAERLDPYDAAQAQFYLGEIQRTRFEELPVDPAAAEERLARALEEKSQLLLAAQGRYLAAIRAGHGGWAVAAGERIGALYDTLHAQLAAAPEPAGLAPDELAAYRGELRRRTRVLLSKAIAAYEQTLAAAERGGVDNRHVAQAQESLERLKRALAEDEGTAAGGR